MAINVSSVYNQFISSLVSRLPADFNFNVAGGVQTETAGHGTIRTIRAMVKAGGTIGKALKELSSDCGSGNGRQL